MSAAFDFGACGLFSRGARLRGATAWPGWNAGASACRPEEAWKLASEIWSSSTVNCPPNWRPPVAILGPNLGPRPLARPPLPPRFAGGGASCCEGSAWGSEGLAASLWPPLPPPRPRPLRPPLCDGPAACPGVCVCCPSSCWSIGAFGFRRGRRRRCVPLEGSPGTICAGGAAVAVDIMGVCRSAVPRVVTIAGRKGFRV
jgi:hypothetical protein